MTTYSSLSLLLRGLAGKADLSKVFGYKAFKCDCSYLTEGCALLAASEHGENALLSDLDAGCVNQVRQI